MSTTIDTTYNFETDQTKLACALVHTDKTVRDATIESIHGFIGNLHKIKELDMLKLWKALYYCLWLTDKAPIQKEVSEMLAKLMLKFENFDMMLLFLQCFCKTIMREWLNL